MTSNNRCNQEAPNAGVFRSSAETDYVSTTKNCSEETYECLKDLDEKYSEQQNARPMPCWRWLLSLDMLEDKALGGQSVGWEFGFLSDFLNGSAERKWRTKTGKAVSQAA
jgi:hypothetical protein